jgi:carboxy-cis,cis-muconate cyclase
VSRAARLETHTLVTVDADHPHDRSIHPSLLDADPNDFRGDTIRISPSTPFIFATTRGKDTSTRGYLCAYQIDPTSGHLVHPNSPPSAIFQTPTSGGRANAIEVIQTHGRGKDEHEVEWLVLTDEQDGLVLVISWNGTSFEQVSRVELLPGDGASHAVWLE